MRRLRRSLVPCLAAGLVWAAPGAAQMSELQLGAIVSYGAPRSFRQGVGAVAGIALGRVAYFGARWVYQAGSQERPTGQGEVTTRTQLLTADGGVMLPFAGVEVVPGISVGAVRYAQSSADQAPTWEVAFAPGLSLHAHVAGIVAIPEIQYLRSSVPRLDRPVPYRGTVAALRLVIPFEVRRIRY